MRAQILWRSRIFYMLLLFLLLFSSCSLKIYGPNYQAVPVLKQKGDIELQGGAGIAEEVYFTDVSMAVAYNSQWGLLAKGSFAKHQNNEVNDFTGHSYFGEMAAVRSWWKYDDILLQLQAGAGFGKQWHRSDNTGSVNFPWQRYYIQPACKYVSKYTDGAISVRMGYVGFGRNVYLLDYNANNGTPLWERLPNRGAFLIEPAMTYGIGYKNFKAYVQWSYAFYSRVFPAEDFYVGVGLTIRLPAKL